MKFTNIRSLTWMLFSSVYLHQFQGLQAAETSQINSKRYEVMADFLYWTAQEAGADVWAEVLTSNQSQYKNSLRDVSFDWNPGFRVGVDFLIHHDQWDTKLYYTYFYTNGKDRVQNAKGTIHSSFTGGFLIANTSGSGLSGPAYEKANIDWDIHYNIFDWELGRKYQTTPSLFLRPFIGLRGGWINQSIHSEWINPDLTSFPQALPFTTGQENLKNNFWGIGPSFGVDTDWYFYQKTHHKLKIFGNFSGAVMYGHWDFEDLYKNNINQVMDVGSSPISGGATMVRANLGFGWDVDFHQNDYRFSANVSYEFQYWLDQLQYYSFTGGRLVNELTLQGGTLALNFAF